jgi:hypothetical protein
MNIVEVVRGTPQERAARETVKKSNGVRPSRPLSEKQAFDMALPLSRRLHRRRMLTLAGSALGTVLLGGAGFVAYEQSQPSSLEKLENELTTPISEEDLQGITSEVAAFYTERTWCRLSAEEMAKRVTFSNFDDFFSALQTEAGRSMSSEERIKERHERLEITTADGRVFFNMDLFNEVVSKLLIQNKIAEASSKENLTRLDLVQSVLFHAFSHVNEENTDIEFEPFSLQIPGKDGLITFDTISGYTISGKDKNGKTQYISGTEEAITERTAIIIGSGMGKGYLSIGGGYAEGADMIARINQAANISDEEFLSYVNGKQQKEEYLRRISTLRDPSGTDIKPAILALSVVGLAVNGVIKPEEANQQIFQYYLNPNS